MILHGNAGERFELTIVGYQFGNVGEVHDRNWLIVRVRAQDGVARWGGQDPCLLTWEARELASWLSTLAGDPSSVAPELDFMEPELSFEVRGDEADGVTLRIGTRYALGAGSGVPEDELDSVSWVARVTRQQIQAAASGFAAELRQWPER